MEKSSKRKLMPLILVAIVGLVVSSVFIAIFVVNLAQNGVDHYSGTFMMKFESRTSGKWTFSAQSA